MSAPAPSDLAEGQRLLAEAPAQAHALARRLLAAAPGHPAARLLLGAALRRMGRPAEAREVLAPLAGRQPAAAGVQYEAGAAHAALGETAAALAAFQRAVALAPRWGLARFALADQHRLSGTGDAPAPPPQAAGSEDRFDAVALRLAAEVAQVQGRLDEADRLLDQALALAPGLRPALAQRALLRQLQGRWSEALAAAEALAGLDPAAPAPRLLRAAAQVQLGDPEAALADYAAVLAAHPGAARARMGHGHALKMVGRTAEAAAAYRGALAAEPGLGEAWWSLANLKTVRFEPEETAAMRRLAARGDLDPEDAVGVCFALGRAMDQAGNWAEAFAWCDRGAALRRRRLGHDPDAHTAFVRRTIAAFPPERLADDGGGAPDPDPIFVVGLPRSGSTLVEQILASHPAVEGLSELSDLTDIARRLAGGRPDAYPAQLAALAPAERAALGAGYLARVGPRRRQGRPFFVDKFPGNVLHLGLIRLVLPRAKVVDVRRHPMACGWSLFSQHFAQGQAYSYDLDHIGRYYADYLALAGHFAAAAPGWTHTLFYEALLADPEGEIRRLLAYCGLPFDEACLRFHETVRPVRTASAAQVRRPLSAQDAGRWRRYSPWLGPLEAALGPALDGYPFRA